MPGTKHSIDLSFEPRNLGVFSNTMELELLNGIYKIPLKLMGSSNSQQIKDKTMRGPNSKPEDFDPQRNYITENEIEMPAQKKKSAQADPTGLPKFL
jgi:hypothetical protein